MDAFVQRFHFISCHITMITQLLQDVHATAECVGTPLMARQQQAPVTQIWNSAYRACDGRARSN